jgi:hypothetical protein
VNKSSLVRLSRGENGKSAVREAEPPREHRDHRRDQQKQLGAFEAESHGNAPGRGLLEQPRAGATYN